MIRIVFWPVFYLFSSAVLFAGSVNTPTEVQPGVWRIRIGEPEAITPVATRHYSPSSGGLAALPQVAQCPVVLSGAISERGVLVRVPLVPNELIYGLGLQLQSFQQRGLKKHLRVNADPAMDTGDSHAPVPFYVTTQGYGIFIDTARYATIYAGNKKQKASSPKEVADRNDGWNPPPGPYERLGIREPSEVLIEIPEARGVDVYVFAGPSLREAVQRFNLYAGGGPLPPRWGLGFWYRVQTDYNQVDLLKFAAEFRERRIPCDVLGLEPHWQTHAYSASYKWSPLFPDPAAMLADLQRQHFRVNLWEHAFVHPSSPIYARLQPRSADYQVWGGLVPDFLDPEARRIFSDYHEKALVLLGVSGFKADECDNSDFTGNWSFPEIARFPSGADGEQMHSLFGLRYQDALQAAFDGKKQRTYGLVRSSGALAAPYPYVLYSDLYDHRQFVHGIAQASFSGLLWTPEVRDTSGGVEELVRRLQSAIFSPLAMINAWYLRNPPWKQVNRGANNAGQFADDWEKTEGLCRQILELRMKFIPYLHAAFVRYHREGLPPFRALIMDFPDDPQTQTIDDEYLLGDSVLVAPVIFRRGPGNPSTAEAKGDAQRSVYLPEGDARVYGDGAQATTLYEDDGTFEPALTPVRIEWNSRAREGVVVRTGARSGMEYSVEEWKTIRE